ncbi:hypothetical protein ACHAPT_009908 [Fusarium lateritium]
MFPYMFPYALAPIAAREPPSSAVVDTRPTESPYLGQVFALIFGGEHYVWVHDRFVRKHPEFAAKFKDGRVHIDVVPPGAAHTLVHYIYTGNYQSLKAPGPGNHGIEKTKWDFKLAVHISSLAQSLGLPFLEDMACKELEGLAPMLQLSTIISILDQQEFARTRISGWLREYIASEVMEAGRNATDDVVREIQGQMTHNQPVTAILCESVARMGMENQRLRRELRR